MYPAPYAAIAIAAGSKDASVINIGQIVDALTAKGVVDPRAMAGALATVACEDNFRSIEEYGNAAHFQQYENRHDLGNDQPGDGIKYRGRSFCQLTGKANYAKYGKEVGVDLLNHPEILLDPTIGAKVFAAFFKDHGLDVHSQRGNWRKVRHLYNGGLNGFDRFQNSVYGLLDLFYS